MPRKETKRCDDDAKEKYEANQPHPSQIFLPPYQMIIGHRAHAAEIVQVVFKRSIVAMPCHHVERGSRQGCLEKLSPKFVEEPERPLQVLEGGNGVLKVARVGQTVCTQGTEL